MTIVTADEYTERERQRKRGGERTHTQREQGSEGEIYEEARIVMESGPATAACTNE